MKGRKKKPRDRKTKWDQAKREARRSLEKAALRIDRQGRRQEVFGSRSGQRLPTP